MTNQRIVVPYNSAWQNEFEKISLVLKNTLGELALHIYHVGSTSIPGMIAKPILDIDVELPANTAIEKATEKLAQIGYVYVGEQGIPDRHAYDRESEEVPYTTPRRKWMDQHLYVCPFGSLELSRHLRFRNSLRNNPELREEYIQVKRRALSIAQGERQVYVDQKEILGKEFFAKILD